MYVSPHVKWHLFLSEFNEIWISSTDLRRRLKYQISWKTVQWESSFSTRKGRVGGRTERRTGLTKLTVSFRKFAIAPTSVHYGITYNTCSCVHITSDDICARSCLLVRIWKFHDDGFLKFEGCSDIEYSVMDSRFDEEVWYILKFIYF
jgi:hypothetical protein